MSGVVTSVRALMQTPTSGPTLVWGDDIFNLVKAAASGQGALTAAVPSGGTSAAGATPIVAKFTEFTTAAAGASALLPNAIAGLEIWITNSGAQNLTVYASPSNVNNAGVADVIVPAAGGATEASIVVGANATAHLFAPVVGRWKSLKQ